MKRVQFITRGDNMQTVYTNPQQFSMLCFVQETVLLSKRQAIEEQKKPSPGFDEDEYRKQAQKEGLIHRSLF